MKSQTKTELTGSNGWVINFLSSSLYQHYDNVATPKWPKTQIRTCIKWQCENHERVNGVARGHDARELPAEEQLDFTEMHRAPAHWWAVWPTASLFSVNSNGSHRVVLAAAAFLAETPPKPLNTTCSVPNSSYTVSNKLVDKAKHLAATGPNSSFRSLESPIQREHWTRMICSTIILLCH